MHVNFSIFCNSWWSVKITGSNNKSKLNSRWCACLYQGKCMSDIALLATSSYIVGINITAFGLRHRLTMQIQWKYYMEKRKWKSYIQLTTWKVSVFWVFLVPVFLHSDWIRRNTEYVSVFSPNAGKYGPEKLRIWTLFTQWLLRNTVRCNA